MKNFQNRFIVILLFCFSLNVYAHVGYIPSQLEQFEKTGICEGCDLSQVNFSFASHDNANLTQALLVKSRLDAGNFNVSNFTNAQVMYASLVSIHASGSNFTQADLTGSDLSNGNFSSANFNGANVTGVNFAGANLVRAHIMQEQLAQAFSLSCTMLPDGTRHASDNGKGC